MVRRDLQVDIMMVDRVRRNYRNYSKFANMFDGSFPSGYQNSIKLIKEAMKQFFEEEAIIAN